MNLDSHASIFANSLMLMRKAAAELGYALGVHGSMQTDLDLIAVPWVETAASGQELATAIASVVGGFIAHGMGKMNADGTSSPTPNPGFKPHGRMAWTIILGGRPYIDLSIMPRLSE